MDLAEVRARVDRGLAGRSRITHDRGDLVSAAVLVPITNPGRPNLVFTKKTASVPHHQGQFAFPGGIAHERDGSPVATALREAWEECRLPATAVEVLGLLDDTLTRATSFVITPVVGIVTEPVAFLPDGREIERVLEVPLEVLRDPAVFRAETWVRDGEAHEVYFYQVSDRDLVWGATARIVKQFLELLDGEGTP